MLSAISTASLTLITDPQGRYPRPQEGLSATGARHLQDVLEERRLEGSLDHVVQRHLQDLAFRARPGDGS